MTRNDKEKIKQYIENNFLKGTECPEYIRNEGIKEIYRKVSTIYDFCLDNNLINEGYRGKFHQYMTELYVPYIFEKKYNILLKREKIGPDFFYIENNSKHFLEVTTSNQSESEDENKHVQKPVIDSNEPFDYFIKENTIKNMVERLIHTINEKQAQINKWIYKGIISKNDKVDLLINIQDFLNDNYQPYTKDEKYKALFFNTILNNTYFKNFISEKKDKLKINNLLIMNINFLDSVNDYLDPNFFDECFLLKV